MDIARMIDQSLLKPDVVRQQVEQLCVQGREHNFRTIVVNPVWVRHCKDILGDGTVGVCTVSGFPLGASKPELKAKEAEVAVRDGANRDKPQRNAYDGTPHRSQCGTTAFVAR